MFGQMAEGAISFHGMHRLRARDKSEETQRSRRRSCSAFEDLLAQEMLGLLLRDVLASQ